MMCIKAYTLLIGLFTVLHTAIGQDTSKHALEESGKVELFPKSYGNKKWKILLGFDAKRSFFKGEKIKLTGLKLGAEYKGVHRFGFGFYWINKRLILNDIAVNQPDEADTSKVLFRLGYSTLFYERVFLKTRFWEVSIPVHLGGGRIEAHYLDTLNSFAPLYQKPFSCITLASQVKFYPITWLYFKVSGGYRQTFNTDMEVKKAFNRGFYSFGLGISVMELYRLIFPKKEKDKPAEEEIR